MSKPRIELVESLHVSDFDAKPDERGNLPLIVFLKGERQTALSVNLN